MSRPDRIREARERLGMTQEALAEQLGVSRQAVSKWEMGSASPSLENLQALSQVLGTELAAGAEDAPAKAWDSWKLLSLTLGCLLLGSLLALGAALHPPEVSEPLPGGIQDIPSITGIAFFDTEGALLQPDLGDGWLYFKEDSRIIVAVSFQNGPAVSVNAVSLFLTPTGTEMLSYRKQLAIQAVNADQEIALLLLDMSPEIIGHMNVTLECNDGQTVTELLNVATLE